MKNNLIYQDLMIIFEENKIDIERYIETDKLFLELVDKISNLKNIDDDINDNLVNYFIAAKILTKEKKKISIKHINKLFSFLLTTMNNLPINKSDMMSIFTRYYSSIREKKVSVFPPKKFLKNFSTYIIFLENDEAYLNAFIFYLLGLSIHMSKYDANIFSKFGMYYTVLMIIKNELKNDDANIFKLKQFNNMDYLDKLHVIGGKLDFYFKKANADLDKMNNKDIKVFLLYELTDLLGEVYNIITKEF